MGKLIRWMAGLAGVAAVAKLLHARPRTVPALTAPESEPEDDPAAELRRKLDEARSAGPEAAESTATAAAAQPEERSLDERRAEIHARAQGAIDAMRNDEA